MGGYHLAAFRSVPPQQKQAAAEFLRWFAQPEQAARWTAVSNYMPGIATAWDTPTLRRSLAEDPRRGVAATQLPEARPRPNLPQYPRIADILSDAFERVMTGELEPATALAQAAREATALLGAGR